MIILLFITTVWLLLATTAVLLCVAAKRADAEAAVARIAGSR
jgi:hypothetical protein